MAWSALGFGLTLLIQGMTSKTAHLYLADMVDGLSSCMGAVCTSYVADCSAPKKVRRERSGGEMIIIVTCTSSVTTVLANNANTSCGSLPFCVPALVLARD